MREQTFRGLVHRLGQWIAKSPVGLPSPTTTFTFILLILFTIAFAGILSSAQQEQNEQFMQDAREALGTDDFIVESSDLLIARTVDGRQFPSLEAVSQFYMMRVWMLIITITVPSCVVFAFVFEPPAKRCSNCGWFNYSFWHRKVCPNCDLNYWLNSLSMRVEKGTEAI